MNEKFHSNSLNELESAIRESSLSKEIGDELIRMGQKKAQKILTKNKHEIKRLEILAKEALFYGKKESYTYAVGKIRKIIGKPVDQDILDTLYKTSREQVLEIFRAGVEAEQKLKG